MLVLGGCAASTPTMHLAPGADACSAEPLPLHPGDPVPEVTRVRPDSDDARELDRWCAGIGRIVVGSAASAPPLDSLLVVAWNNNVGQGDLAAFIDRIHAVLDGRGWGRHQFVLLLQEAWSDGSYNQVPRTGRDRARGARQIGRDLVRPEDSEIVRAARRFGLGLFYAPSMRNGMPVSEATAEDRGNAILTPLPLRDLQVVELPFESQRRAPLVATLAGTTTGGASWCLAVANVHLDNRSGRWSLLGYVNSFGRTRQMRGLLQTLPEDRPLLLGGDLNTLFWSGERGSEGTIDLVRKAFDGGTPFEDPVNTSFAGPFGVPLDHLAWRLPEGWGEPSVEFGERLWGSDHLPLFAFLGVEPAGGC